MLMRYFLTTLMVLCCMSMAAMAQNNSDQNVDFQILDQDHTSTPIYRAPAFVPIQGYYLSSNNTLILSFAYDLGIANVCIENDTEGVVYTEDITALGVWSYPLDNPEGLFNITLSLVSGQQYTATLELLKD